MEPQTKLDLKVHQQIDYIIGCDFSSHVNDITNIIVGKITDGVFQVIDHKQMKCQKYDDQRQDSEFNKTLEQFKKLYNAKVLGRSKAFRKPIDKINDYHQSNQKAILNQKVQQSNLINLNLSDREKSVADMIDYIFKPRKS